MWTNGHIGEELCTDVASQQLRDPLGERGGEVCVSATKKKPTVLQCDSIYRPRLASTQKNLVVVA